MDSLSTPNDDLPGPEELLPLHELRRLVEACHARLGHPLPASEVEEAVQETAIAVWRRWASYSGRSSPESWAFGVARLALLGRMRTLDRERSSIRRISGELELEDSEPSRTPIETAFRRSLDELLGQAGTTDADILRQRFLARRSFREIAAALGRPEASVRSRLHRALPAARKRLRRLWEVL